MTTGQTNDDLLNENKPADPIGNPPFAGVLKEWKTVEQDGETVPQHFAYDLSQEQIERLNKSFTYHPPKVDQVMRYQSLRDSGAATATLMCLHCPPSRELSLALTHLQEAIMWANAAIACNE